MPGTQTTAVQVNANSGQGALGAAELQAGVSRFLLT